MGTSDKSPASLLKVLAPALTFLNFEGRELVYILIYTVVVGVAGLASTVAIQVLVNELTFTGQSYPVLVLSLLVVIILAFGSTIQIMRRIVVEYILQRVLIRTSFAAVDALSTSTIKRGDESQKEIVHRFFDVFSYEKAMTRILLDGIGVVIVSVIGTLIVSFYHPFLAFYILFVMAVFIAIVIAFSRRAVETNYEQSTHKYKLAAWLAAVADSRSLVSNTATHAFLLEQTDHETNQYLSCRRRHFFTLLWQSGSLLTLQGLAAGLLLGVSGMLVVWGKIDLGQLVAAEVILMAVLAGLVDFGKTLESAYDLIVAAEKLQPLVNNQNPNVRAGHLDDLQVNQQFKIEVGASRAPTMVEMRLGQVVAVKGSDAERRRQLLWNIAGFESSGDCEIEFNETPIDMISQRWFRKNMLLIDKPAVFEVDFWTNLSLLKKKDIKLSAEVMQHLPLFDRDFFKGELKAPATKWSSDPRVRLYVALSRAFFTSAPVVLVDHLFSELSRPQKAAFLKHFREHCPDKLLIINCEADADLPEWTKVIEWT